jgi:glucose/arabinose dehydrogenase
VNSKVKKLTAIIVLILILIFAGYYLFKKNFGTVNIPADAINKTGVLNTVEGNTAPTNAVPSLSGFTLPAGFSLNIFAKNVPGARVIEIDPKGRILVSETGEGKIVALSDTNNDNVSDQASERKILASGLHNPHGLAIKCDNAKSGTVCFLYVAESDELSRFPYDAGTLSLGNKEKLMPISSGITDRHFTRSLIFLPPPNQDTLLISVGSSCDVCHENNPDYASILSYNIKTGEKAVYAKGLRNATFMTLNPVDNKVYATEMGHDNLGDNIPPDEINIIEKDKNYGWPNCYGKNIHDTVFDKNTYIRNPCMEPFETPSFVDLQAHSAPLGLAFVPTQSNWPEKYKSNLLVAFHGSWNRSVPTGYKIALIKMNAKGEYLGTEDFIIGWLTKAGTKTGRPVDIKVLPGGVAYISDDSAGVIYRLTFK